MGFIMFGRSLGARPFATCVVLSMAALLAAGAIDDAVGAERHVPLRVSADHQTVFAADPRLSLDREGTVEMWVRARTRDHDEERFRQDPFAGLAPRCLLQRGSDDDLDYKIAVTADLKGLLYTGADGTVAADVDLSDGSYHHVAFVVAGDRVMLHVDGQEQILPLEVSHARPSVEGRALAIGCSGADPFDGWVASLRFFSRALSGDDLQAIKGSLGVLPPTAPPRDDLVAYATFSNARTALSYTAPEIAFTPLAGGPDGEVEFHKRSYGMTLAGLFVSVDGRGVADIITEYDHPDRRLGTFTRRAPLIHALADGVSAHRAVVDEAERLAAAEALAPDVADRDGTIAEAKAELRRWIQIHRTNAFGFDDDGIRTGAGGDPNRPTYSVFRPEGGRSTTITSVVGEHDGRQLTQLRFSYAFDVVGPDKTRLTELFSDHLPPRPRGSQRFRLTIADGARFEGLTLKRDDGRISAIGLAYSEPEVSADAKLAHGVAEGTWIDRNFHEPERADAVADTWLDLKGTAAADLVHGTYQAAPYYSFAYNPAGQQLTMWREAPDEREPIKVFHFPRQDGHIWHDLDGNTLILGEDRVSYVRIDEDAPRILVRPPAYAPPNPNKVAWGGTFAVEQRPTFVDANFKGYNPMKMRARDNQSTSGSTKHIFAFPDEHSHDYFFTSNHMIVPHGLFFRLANRGSERDKTVVTETAQSRQSSWGAGIGLSAGIPLVAAFSEDGSYQQEQATMASQSYSTGIAKTVQTRHALVLDRGRMRLDPQFKQRIEELLIAKLNDRPRDYTAFFKAFGTHFANAVTYGGMAYLETFIDTSESQTSSGTSEEIKGKVSGTLEDILNIGTTGDYKQSHREEMRELFSNQRAWFDTIGGSISQSNGWTLARTEEVPLLLDLRPIHTLLGPTFFDDPLIWQELRPEMADALTRYANAWAELSRAWAASVPGNRAILDAGTRNLDCTGAGCVEP